MYTKKILIIGAGFLQTFVIKKAKELGYYVISIDGNPKAEGFRYADQYECIDIVDEKTCLNYAKSQKIDGVMTAATDYGVLTASYIAQELGLPGLSYHSAQLVKNKYMVRKKFYDYHIDDTGRSFEVSQYSDIEKIAEKLIYPVMVKPCDGSGSRGAQKVTSKEILKDACENALKNSLVHKAEIEPFIDGREYGAESFVYQGKVYVMAIMKKWMTEPPYYAELGHAIPSGLNLQTENRIKSCVVNAVRALGINFGAVNMDLLVTKNGEVHIIDVGARMGGNLIGSHIVPMGTGIDYLGNLIHAAVNEHESVRLAPKYKNCSVATRLLALSPGRVVKLPDFDEFTKKDNIRIFHHLHVGDIINEYHTNLDGCGYIVATSNDINNAVKKVVHIKDQIDHMIERG